jgi:hypothetical protein
MTIADGGPSCKNTVNAAFRIVVCCGHAWEAMSENRSVLRGWFRELAARQKRIPGRWRDRIRKGKPEVAVFPLTHQDAVISAKAGTQFFSMQ